MASLQDQLLKAGLVSKHRAKLADKEKRKQTNHARKTGTKTVDETKSAVKQKHAKRVERDRALNQQKQQATKRKEIKSQLRQIIEVNKHDRSHGEIPYRFVYDNKVKNLLVTAEQKNGLVSGKFVIVTGGANETFEIVTNQVAQKIGERDAQSVVQLNVPPKAVDPDDDPYADYQIPDDLIW